VNTNIHSSDERVDLMTIRKYLNVFMDGHGFLCFFDSFSRSVAQSVKLEDGSKEGEKKLREVELTLQLEGLQTLERLKSVQEHVLCPKVH
jgi:hypothetical protein